VSVLDWLRTRDDGLQYIDGDTQKLIIDFSLIWMYFEANYLGTDGSPPVLLSLVQLLADADLLDAAGIEPHFAYFQGRYVADDGHLTSHFEDLGLTDKYRAPVEAALRSPKSLRDQLEACVLILNRYRNNLFHGPKWIARFVGDEKNLSHAIALVSAVVAMRDKASPD
jgi:hypothetical protein